jgi:hypothetical protein
MNKKRFKKLSLSTETLRNLGDSDLKHAAGAVSLDNTECTGVCSGCTRGCSACTVACSVCCP